MSELSNEIKSKAITLLEEEFGKWLDQNKDLIVKRIPKECKIYPLLCGSLVEGFLSKGSDLDFSVMIDDRKEKPRIRGKFSRQFKHFVEELNGKVKSIGLDHVCDMARKVRTVNYLLMFENCKNPQFRVNYFLFSKLLIPKVMSKEVKERLASFNEFLEFKKNFQSEYRKKFGFQLFKVKDSVFMYPEKYSPKRIYRELQLIVNTFLMAYGLEAKKLTEKMEKELQIKVAEILKSTLTRKAIPIMELKSKSVLRNLYRWKEIARERYKRKRLNFLLKSGVIKNEELNDLKIVLKFFKEFVYEPLLRFSKIQVELANTLNNCNIDIQWLGLRKDHAYISLHNHPKIVCFDILLSKGEGFDVYVKVKKEFENERKNKGFEMIFEKEIEDSSIGIPLSRKIHLTHLKSGRGRIHFKILTLTDRDDVSNIQKKLQEICLWSNHFNSCSTISLYGSSSGMFILA